MYFIQLVIVSCIICFIEIFANEVAENWEDNQDSEYFHQDPFFPHVGKIRERRAPEPQYGGYYGPNNHRHYNDGPRYGGFYAFFPAPPRPPPNFFGGFPGWPRPRYYGYGPGGNAGTGSGTGSGSPANSPKAKANSQSDASITVTTSNSPFG